MKLHSALSLYFILTFSICYIALMVQADENEFDDKLTLHKLFKRATERDDDDSENAGVASITSRDQKKLSKKRKGNKSLKELNRLYSTDDNKKKFNDKLLKLDEEDRLKFFRQRQLKQDKKYRKQVLKMLRKQARKNRKNKKLKDKNTNSSLSASSLILQVNEALNLTRNLWEGDIIVPDTVIEADTEVSAESVKSNLKNGFSSTTNERTTSQAQSGIGSNIWSDARVPYVFDQSYPAKHRSKIEKVMEDIEDETCIKFVQRTTEVDYVHILSGLGCSAPVGKHAAMHIVSLESGSCTNTEGIIAHELGHVLGLHHTQSRLDRDNYINIDLSKVAPEYQHNFNTYANPHTDDFAVEYDYNSVMHYGRTDFSTDGTDVITPIIGTALIGQRLGMSYFDYVTINQMYGCYDKTPYYWPMDEIDMFDKNVVGSTSITPSNPTSPLPPNFLVGLDNGKFLNALRIRGTKAYANLGSFPDQCLVDPEKCHDGFTFGMWYKDKSSAKDMSIRLLSSYEPQTGPFAKDRGIEIVINKDPSGYRLLSVTMQRKSKCIIGSSFGTVQNDWNHIVVIYEPNSGYLGNDIDIYVNGFKDSLAPAIPCSIFSTNIPDINPSLTVGLSPTLPEDQYIDFWIDDIAFFPRELSFTDILKLKNDGAYFDKGLSDGSLGKKDDVIGSLESFTSIL